MKQSDYIHYAIINEGTKNTIKIKMGDVPLREDPVVRVEPPPCQLTFSYAPMCHVYPQTLYEAIMLGQDLLVDIDKDTYHMTWDSLEQSEDGLLMEGCRLTKVENE